MKIVDIRELTVPLTGNIANAVVNFSAHTVSFVALRSDVLRGGKPVTGVAFNSIGRFAQGGLLRERFFPRLAAAADDALLQDSGTAFCPEKIQALLLQDEKPGGHGDRAAAVAALELAIWDLNAKLEDEPAWHHIARATGNRTTAPAVPVYAAGGYYHDNHSPTALADELQSYQAQGFTQFKIKIGGAPLAEDLARIDSACRVAKAADRVAVDANGRFDASAALGYAQALAPYGLRWYEEPGDPLDYALQQSLAEQYSGALATGENLFSCADVQNLLRYAGLRPNLDVLQMDPGLSYGLTEYLRMIALVEAQGLQRAQLHPHGGHLINLHIAAALQLGGCEAYPGVFQPFGGFSDGCLNGDGTATPGDAPGFGLEQKTELMAPLAQLLT